MVAGLVPYITNIGIAQQTTVVYGLQGARANQAACRGIEWGISQAIASIGAYGYLDYAQRRLQATVSLDPR